MSEANNSFLSIYFAISQTIFLCYVIWWTPVKYGKTTPYPAWAHTLGFSMSLASMMWIPGYAVYFIVTQRGSFKDVSGTHVDF